ASCWREYFASGLLDAERDHASHQRRARISCVDEGTHGIKSGQRRVVLTVAGQIVVRENDGIGPAAGTPTSQVLPAIALLEPRTIPSRTRRCREIFRHAERGQSSIPIAKQQSKRPAGRAGPAPERRYQNELVRLRTPVPRHRADDLLGQASRRQFL